MPAQEEIDRLSALARELAAESELAALWTGVVQAGIAHVAGAERGSVILVSDASVSTHAASDDAARNADEHQRVTRAGPGIVAAVDHQPVVHIPDVQGDTRWPEFSKAIAACNIRSVLSLRLRMDRAHTFGALNLYASHADAFTDDSIKTGMLLVGHADVAALAVSRAENLRIALQSRDLIGQAKGILMERHKLTSAEAFDLLVTVSQHTHRKLRDVAFELVSTGELELD